jgi:hypothetical protein
MQSAFRLVVETERWPLKAPFRISKFLRSRIFGLARPDRLDHGPCSVDQWCTRCTIRRNACGLDSAHRSHAHRLVSEPAAHGTLCDRRHEGPHLYRTGVRRDVVIPEELPGLSLGVICTISAVSLLAARIGGNRGIGPALTIVCVATSLAGTTVFVLGRRHFPGLVMSHRTQR